MEKKRSLGSNVKLRLQLFRIWFMKNILVWLQVFLIVCVICMLTGNITSSTPVLGRFIYPIFEPLITEIILIVEDKQIDGLMDFFAIAISILTSIGLFTLKLRGIAQSDIKSDNLKIALIKANLYFNADGKLVKKTEKMTQTDLDGDGKIDDKEEVPVTKGLFSGIATAVKEFKVIATVDLSGDDEQDEKNYEKAVEEAGLLESEKALKEIDKTVLEGADNIILEKVNTEVDKRREEIMDDTTIEKKEKIKRVGVLDAMKNWLKIRKNKKDEIKESNDVEVVQNNIDSHAEIKKEDAKKENPIAEIVITKTTTTKKVVSDAKSFLDKF